MRLRILTPVTEGELPIAHTPAPEAVGEPAAPVSDTDFDTTIDYENQRYSSEDVFFRCS